MSNKFTPGIHTNGSVTVYQGCPDMFIINYNNNPILTITSDGDVIWNEPHDAVKAAQIFAESLSFSIECIADIRQSRVDWEQEKKNSIRRAIGNNELTMKKLNEIFRKHEFKRKLAGI